MMKLYFISRPWVGGLEVFAMSREQASEIADELGWSILPEEWECYNEEGD